MSRNTAGLKRGGPGRTPGIPNKVSQKIKEASRALVEDPVYVTALKRRLNVGRAPHMETLLFHYAYGKPKDITDHQGEIHLRVTWES